MAVADMLALLGATVLTRAAQQHADHFLAAKTNSLVDEMRRITGAALPDWSGWKPLPEPVIFPGDIPEELRKNA
ncbi:MAG: hypothetical protein ACTHKZ_00095 [Lysobacteraceae bacterium]